MNDLRFALRQLLKNPGFTAVAVLTLALCLGANLAIFAVVDSVLLRPLPFPEADRLVTMFNSYPKAGVDRDGSSLANYYERRGAIEAFSHLAIYRPGSAIVGEAGATERDEVIRVSPDFFATLGVNPRLGRAFEDSETTYQTDGVVILTASYWRQNLQGDPGVIGRTVRVDGLAKTVVGVLPPDFGFLSSRARLYLPLSSNVEARGASERHAGSGSELIGRLKHGATLIEAGAQIAAQDVALAPSFPRAKMIADAGHHTVLLPLHTDHVKSIRPTLLLLQAGVLFLLLIGGVNLVNLLLIRAAGRGKELSIRQSLGASRRHIVQQVLSETVLLALMGGIAGLGIAAGGIRLLGVLGIDQLPLGAHVAFNARLAGIAMIGSAVLGVVIALPIAWFNLRGEQARAFQFESRGATSGLAGQRLRHGFIVAQIALAFLLLAGAGLLSLSLKRVMEVSPGFRADHVLTGQISLPWNSYRDNQSRVAFSDRLLDEVAHLPGVLAAGAINTVPLTGNGQKSAITIPGYTPPPGETVRGHYSYGVAGNYFAALGIPLQAGRFVESVDSRNPVRTCVVDEDLARRYWPNGNALGQRLFQGGQVGTTADAFTVVGVVGVVKQTELTEERAQGAVYFPLGYHGDDKLFVVTRTSQAPEAFSATLQKIVRKMDPDLPVNDLQTMDVRIANSLVARRSPALLAGIFAGVALLLAALGTYGVLSYAVAQRRREIGVRMALGARPQQIGRQFLTLGLQLVAAGIFLGVGGAWLAGRAMQGVLFNVPAWNPAILAGTVAVMAAISLVACWLPARRASRVDPMVALRSE